MAYLFGFLIGDGCLTQKGVAIATGRQDANDRLAAWLAVRLPKLHVYPYFNVRSWYLSLSCSELLNQPGYGNRKTKLHYLLQCMG